SKLHAGVEIMLQKQQFFQQTGLQNGNNKRTHLWLDKIMGKEPLAENVDITNLRDWLKQAGVNNLYDLSNWDQRGDWAGWD
ncbi:hypothetical protein, partial [Actinobacillus pleuropneumoniae]